MNGEPGSSGAGESRSTADVYAALPSLLWPVGESPARDRARLTATQAQDLALDVLIRALDWTGGHARFIRATLAALAPDPGVIGYRQAILRELAARESLRDRLIALLPSLRELARPRSAAWAQESPLLLVPPRLSDLELYVSCVSDLHAALRAEPLESQGLCALRDHLAARVADPQFESLATELPALREQIDRVRSVTIGVNLDGDLRPTAATLVAINAEPFSGPRTLTHRLFGRDGVSAMPGATALRSISERSPQTDPLARDLEKLLAETVQPVAAGLERFGRINARPLAALEPEIAFYIGAIRLAKRLTACGLPVCLPEIDDSRHRLIAAYNPSLALQLDIAAGESAPVVSNPIDFDDGRIVVLTGPNRGGKTTYLRAVGVNQVLFQAGIYVAAEAARLTPADVILTHFPPAEGTEPGGGRLDDEARRVREIFAAATRDSLLLFNEPLTSTGEREAQQLARDVVRALRLLDARTIYVTHLHALAGEADTLNREPGGTVVSWVAGVAADEQRTYAIRRGPPLDSSHAAAIAEQQGITYAQLARQLAARSHAPDRGTPARGSTE
jgi:DNA mismatch repair protein MutS